MGYWKWGEVGVGEGFCWECKLNLGEMFLLLDEDEDDLPDEEHDCEGSPSGDG